MEIKLDCVDISVLIGLTGPDRITFYINGPSPFPELDAASLHPGENYRPDFVVQTRNGYAQEWLRKMGFNEYRLIDAQTGRAGRVIYHPGILKPPSGTQQQDEGDTDECL